MLHFVIGLPGPFAEWCEEACVALATRALGPTPLLHADTPEELARAVIGAGGTRAIVSARHPGGQLRAALVESQSPFLLVLDDPRRVLMALVTRGVEFFAALRLVASACATMRDCGALPGALVLRAGADGLEASGAIAQHLGLAVPPQEIAGLVTKTVADKPAADLRTWWSMLPPWARGAAEGALALYERGARHGTPIRWEPDLFWCGEQPGAPLQGGVDITGRGRVVLSGPGIVLPHGVWHMKARLRVSVHAAKREFVLEALAGRTLASCTMTPSEAGLFEAQATLVMDASVDHPLLLRLSLKRAAFDGEITLEGVMLTPATV